jgi:hypothetical protein
VRTPFRQPIGQLASGDLTQISALIRRFVLERESDVRSISLPDLKDTGREILFVDDAA